MILQEGKVPKSILENIIFRNLGIHRPEVAVGPAAGIDAAVIDADNKSWVLTTDPITGARKHVGWLAVNINANDIATFGVRPAYFLCTILLPRGTSKKIVRDISNEMGEAAQNLNTSIIGGHCEITLDLNKPVIVGCMIGVTEKGKYITSAEAEQGDRIILTKTPAIEGTAILATEKSRQLRKILGAKQLFDAQQFYKEISIVKEAVTAFEMGAANAMHDPTEGGIAGGIHEIADASNLGFTIHEEEIRIRPETRAICNFFRIDPLQLLASGSLLIASKPNFESALLDALRKEKIEARTVGEFNPHPSHRKIIRESGKIENLVRPESDHIWKTLKKS